ncbi:hypothetical protein GEMRC1_011758 [Eukaryota sp. GEM-RC1]
MVVASPDYFLSINQTFIHDNSGNYHEINLYDLVSSVLYEPATFTASLFVLFPSQGIQTRTVTLTSLDFLPKIQRPSLTSFTPVENGKFQIFCSATELCGVVHRSSLLDCPRIFDELDDVVLIDNYGIVTNYSAVCFYNIPKYFIFPNASKVDYLVSAPVFKSSLPLLKTSINLNFSNASPTSFVRESSTIFLSSSVQVDFDLDDRVDLTSNYTGDWTIIKRSFTFDVSEFENSNILNFCLRAEHPNFSPSLHNCYTLVFLPLSKGNYQLKPGQGSSLHVPSIKVIPEFEVDVTYLLTFKTDNINRILQILLTSKISDSSHIDCSLFNFRLYSQNPSFCIVDHHFVINHRSDYLLISISSDSFPSVICDFSSINYDFLPSFRHLYLATFICTVAFILVFIFTYSLIFLKHLKLTRIQMVSNLRKVNFYTNQSKSDHVCHDCGQLSSDCISTGSIVSPAFLPSLNATLGQTAPRLGKFASELIDIAHRQEQQPLLCQSCYKKWFLTKISKSVMSASLTLPFVPSFNSNVNPCYHHLLLNATVPATITCHQCTEEKGQIVNLCLNCCKYLHKHVARHSHSPTEIQSGRVITLRKHSSAVTQSKISSAQFSPIKQTPFSSPTRSGPGYTRNYVPPASLLIRSLLNVGLLSNKLKSRFDRPQFYQTDSPVKTSPFVEEIRLRTPQSIAVDLSSEAFSFDTIVFD